MKLNNRFVFYFQIHAGSSVSDIQRTVDDRDVRGIRQRDAILDGNLSGCILRRGVRYSALVGGLSVKVHGLLWKASLHQKADLYNR